MDCRHTCPTCHKVFSHKVKGSLGCHMRERGRMLCERDFAIAEARREAEEARARRVSEPEGGELVGAAVADAVMAVLAPETSNTSPTRRRRLAPRR